MKPLSTSEFLRTLYAIVILTVFSVLYTSTTQAGLAASQARLMMLTSRLSDIDFQSQEIIQQQNLILQAKALLVSQKNNLSPEAKLDINNLTKNYEVLGKQLEELKVLRAAIVTELTNIKKELSYSAGTSSSFTPYGGKD